MSQNGENPLKKNTKYIYNGPGLDLKLHPGVRSSRNSMKVLTARTDVSYLRDYKTGGEEGYAGRFCAFRVFLFFSNPASPLSSVHSLCLSVGVRGTSPSPQGAKRPCPLLCKFTLAGYINAGSGWPPQCYDGCSHPEHKWPAVRPESLYGVSLPRLWVTVCCL